MHASYAVDERHRADGHSDDDRGRGGSRPRRWQTIGPSCRRSARRAVEPLGELDDQAFGSARSRSPAAPPARATTS